MSAIEEARTTNQPTVLCVALAFAAGFIFLSLDEQDTANIYGEELVAHAYKHALRPFYAADLCVRGSLAGLRCEAATGVDMLRSGPDEMRKAIYLLFDPFFRMELAMALGAIGRVNHGIREIDKALRNAVETDYRWFVPKILRIKGRLLLPLGPDGSTSIEDLFLQAMMQARAQKAAYWELSAATSLAKLLRSQHREVEARAILSPVYNRFTGGFSASRVQQAKVLLDRLVQ
jgi:non-specific serine/threonine protein kinase